MKKTIEFLLFALVVECFSSTMKAVSFPSESYGSDESSMTSNATNSYMTNSSVENNVYMNSNSDLQSQNNVNNNTLGEDPPDITEIGDFTQSIKITKDNVKYVFLVYEITGSSLEAGSPVLYNGTLYHLASTATCNGVTFNSSEVGGYVFVVNDAGEIVQSGGALVNIVPLSDCSIYFCLLLLLLYTSFKIRRISESV